VESLNAVGASREALTLYGSFDGFAMKRDESGYALDSEPGKSEPLCATLTTPRSVMHAAMRRRIHEMSVARIDENADAPGASQDVVSARLTRLNLLRRCVVT
jgi:hypothetical protein